MFVPLVLFSKFRQEIEAALETENHKEKYKKSVRIVAVKCNGAIKTVSDSDEHIPPWQKWLGDVKDGFSENEWKTLKDTDYDNLRKLHPAGQTALERAIVFHYRLHASDSGEQTDVAYKLNKIAFGRKSSTFLGPLFRTEPDKIKYVKPTAPFTHPPYMLEEDVDDLLKGTQDHGVWLDPHNHHSIKLEGREKEKLLLTKFIKDPRRFVICPVIGPSGAGKTRLISEWMVPYVPTVSDTDWDAGFVVSGGDEKARDPKPWEDWEISKHTLIVIDYTFAFDRVAAAIVRKAREQNDYNVRLIVVDHVMPEFLHDDFFWREIGGRHSSGVNSVQAQHVVSAIELKAEGDSSKLLRSVIAQSANLGGDEYTIGHPVVVEALGQLDRIGHDQDDTKATRHPLFAALMGQAIRDSKGEIIDFSAWSRRDLITYYFKNPDRLPWTDWEKDQEKQRSLGLSIGAVVSAATLRRGLPISQARKVISRGVMGIVQRANRIISSDDELVVKPFLPDILGEAFVLLYLEALEDRPEAYSSFIDLLCRNRNAGNEREIAANVQETIIRLAHNLANDDQALGAVRSGWDALSDFLAPERFESSTLIRTAVSYAIAAVMEILANLRERESVRANLPLLGELDDIRERLEALFRITDIEAVCQEEDCQKATQVYFQFFEHAGRQDCYAYLKALKKIAVQYAAQSRDKTSATMLAANDGYLGVVQALYSLLEHDFRAVRKDGWTALMNACANGHLAVVEYLIAKNGQVNVTTDDGLTPLNVACVNGHLAVVEYFIAQDAQDAQVSAVTEDGGRALVLANQNGHLVIVEYFIAQDAQVKVTMDDGWTALMLASQNGHLAVVDYLFAQDVHVDTATVDGATVLVLASRKGLIAVLEYLIVKGAGERCDG